MTSSPLHTLLRRALVCALVPLAVGSLLIGCGGDDGGSKPGGGGDPAGGGVAGGGVENDAAKAARIAAEDALLAEYADVLDLPEVTYRWNKDAGDKSVPAEMGGPGFTGEGWESNMTHPAIGWPDAPRGGTIKSYLPDWPATLRLHGENWNTSFNYDVNPLCAERLLILHPSTLEFVPCLATHWQISEDKQTYRFRLNPDARYSDGSEVVASDWVATYRLLMDPTCRFPSSLIVWGKFHEPVAVSKYIIEVKVKEDSWRNFQYFASNMVFPAKYIDMPGGEFLEKYQNSYFPLSGAYEVKAEDIKLGKSIAITRRKNHWREGDPAFAGMANIERFEFEVVKDPNLAYEKAKKGELDLFYVPKAQWWATEIGDLEPVQRGLIQMRKIHNDAPIGTSGIAINSTKPPLDDVRIRKALQHLYNRELMIEKFYYNEYLPLTSYWQGGTYANPDNEYVPYDEFAAVELLEQAGWTETNSELNRVKNGQVLEFELVYRSKLSERSLTLFQADCKKAGIKITLRLVTNAEHFKSMTAMEYQLGDMAWGALVFPNPESSWKGELAEQTGNNNITGFANARVDELLTAYDASYDLDERIKVMREIDGTIYKEHPYVLGWFGPARRFMYWNKIGMPPWGCPRTSDNSDYWYYMWIDPAKKQQLEAARKDSSLSMPKEKVDNRFWEAWNIRKRRQEQGK